VWMRMGRYLKKYLAFGPSKLRPLRRTYEGRFCSDARPYATRGSTGLSRYRFCSHVSTAPRGADERQRIGVRLTPFD
jgi:hypothetical protein